MSNYKSIYQDLKFFDKNGYEIPLIIASNIVIKMYNKFGSEKDATVMNGVYHNRKDDKGNFIIDDVRIINVGKSFSFEEIEIDHTIIDVYVDGVMIEDFTFNKINILETLPFNIAYTSSNADLKEYIKYGIKDIDLECVISKKELDDLFNTDYEMPFPSLIFNADINMEKVSTGLHSVESLYFGIEHNGNLIKPFDSKYDIEFITDIKDEDVQFFVVDPNTDEIYKKHKIIVDLSDDNTLDDEYFDITSNEFNNIINEDEIITKTPQINICFSSPDEGVHEQKIYIMLTDRENNENSIKIGEFNVIVEAEGEDERFRALFANFGIPDPIMYPSLFKECDIKEDKTNWEIVNRKSKELFLTYDEIFPYVGTYKALINAVKYLGYNDVYFREWYKDIKKNIKYSKRININENFNDNKSYITYDNLLENRMNQKKLNKLSLIYKINEETEETDEYNIPILRNVYNYTVDEVYLKLKSLKEWLEKNIIALNCRIIEITGEGVVYERYSHINYGTIMQNLEHIENISYEPYVKNKIEKLVDGSANIKISTMNDSTSSYLTFNDFNESFKEYELSSNGTIKFPFIYNFHSKAFVENNNAIIKNNMKSGALFINDNRILLLKDEKGNLINAIFDKAPIIQLQNATLKEYSDIKNDTYKKWWNDISFNVNKKIDDVNYYIRDAKKEQYRFSNEFIMLIPINEDSTFEYSYKEDIDAPIFVLKGYKLCLYNKNTYVYDDNFINKDQKYILNITKGNIIDDTLSDNTSYISFDYLEDSDEQIIKMNYQFENTNYIEKKNKKDTSIANYDNYYDLNVNKTGKYKIITYLFNEYGNIFAKELMGGCEVVMEKPTIKTYIDKDYIKNDSSFYYEDSSTTITKNITTDNLPSLKWHPHIFDINLNDKTIKYPNLSYAYDIVKNGGFLNLSNINDKFIYHSNVNKKQFTFYSINKMANGLNVNDKIQFIIYSKKVLNGIYEYSGTITKIYKNGYYDILFDEEVNIKNYISNNYEFYIIPINEYEVKSVELNIDNNTTDIYIDGLSNKHNQTFYKNDIIKLLYQIGGEIINNNLLYYSEDGINFNEVLYNYNNEFYPVTLNENGDVVIVDDAKRTNIFCGGATFKIKNVDYENNKITLEGIFNYKKYNEEYLFYKDEKDNNKLKPLKILNSFYILEDKDNIKESFVKLTTNSNLIKTNTNLYIAKANQSYVNYVLNAEDSVETPYEDTTINIKNNRLFDFIDESYSLVITNFDKVNAFDNWAGEINENLFEHDKPLTINKNTDVIYKLHSDNYSISFIRWNVYKQNLNNKTRELLFEVENETLALNIKDSGIYDIEVYAFDKHGNMAYKDYQAILNVK